MQGFRDRGAQVTRVEAFVDAAFAFAITLMAVAGEAIPTSVDALVLAMKGLPAFALSFALIVRFWSGHASWSKAYGLDDPISQRLSLLLVMLLLVFVYPVRMVFASLCNWLSQGWLPAGFEISGLTQIPVLFITFGAAFGSMGAVMWGLYFRAWRLRASLGLTPAECLLTQLRLWTWGMVPAVAVLSISLALLIPAERNSGWWLGLPGLIYFWVNLFDFLITRWGQRRIAAMTV
jgi:hypothetical protein